MRLKPVLAVVAGVAVLLVAGAAIFVYTLDIDRYRDVVAAEAKALTGRDLKIGGPLQLDLFAAAPALVAESVSLANAPWASEPEMIRVKRLEIQVRLVPLLSGRFEIVRLVLVEPNVLLETDRNGVPNWRFQPAGTGAALAESTGDPGELPSVENVRIDNARIVYRDGASGSTGDLTLESVTLKAADFRSPIELAVRGALDKRPVEIGGTFGPLTDLMAGRPYPGKFSGRFGNSDIAGTIEADLGRAPVRVTGKLASKVLDIDDLDGGDSRTTGSRKLFSGEKLDLGALAALAGEITYDIDRLAGIAPEPTSVKIKAVMKDGILTAPLTTTIADGALEAQLTVDARAAPPRLALKATLKGAALGTLTKAIAGNALVTAPVDAEIDVVGAGDSLAAVMAALNGFVRATAGAGAVHSDFYAVLSASPLRAINPLAAGEGPPRLHCMVVRFDFASGRGQSRVLLADSSRSTVLGHGAVLLKEEYVDILLVPSTKHTSAASVASLIPIRLRGPLADPSFRPDPGEAAMETAKSIIGLAELPLNIVGSVLGVGRIFGQRGGDTCAAAIGRAGGPAPDGAASGGSAPARREGGGLLQRLNPFGR
jgi:uncharacterized protein involved in outer membrane biogenesis